MVKVRQRFAYPHEDDIVDLFAARTLDGNDLIDDFVRAQIPRKPVQTARAKHAPVGTTNLRRNTRCPAVRFLSIERRRRWNQNRLYRAPIAQAQKEFQSGVARSKNADDVDLAHGKTLSELRSQRPWQIAHLLKGPGTLFVKPVHNLPGTIKRLAQPPKFGLKLIKQERFDLGISRHGHEKAYGPAELASTGLQVTFAAVIKRIAIPAVLFLAIAFLISACVSRDEDVSERSSSQSAASVPGEKSHDEGAYAPGPPGSSGSVRW